MLRYSLKGEHMVEEPQLKFTASNPNKLDLILLTLQRIQEDLHLAKCEIQTSIREVSNHQNYVSSSLAKLNRSLEDIDGRLHGLELRRNSST